MRKSKWKSKYGWIALIVTNLVIAVLLSIGYAKMYEGPDKIVPSTVDTSNQTPTPIPSVTPEPSHS